MVPSVALGSTLFVAVAVLVAVVPRTAWSQVATTEQKLPGGPVSGFPAVAGRGPAAVAASLAALRTPNIPITTNYSLDGGQSWSPSASLPLVAPYFAIHAPTAVVLGPSGASHLLTNSDFVQYNRGDGPPPFTWTNPLIALYKYNADLFGYDLHSVACDESGVRVFVTASESNWLPSAAGRVWFARSLDDGVSWGSPLQLGSDDSKGSSIAVAGDGTIYVSWVDYALGELLVSQSVDHGASFSSPVVAAVMNDNLAMRPLGWRDAAALRTERFYPYYLSYGSNFGPNFPALAVDRSGGPTRGTLYAVWAEHAGGVPAPATQLIRQVEPNDTPGTAQVVPLDCDILGGLASVDVAPDLDYYVFELTKGQTIWIDSEASLATTGWELHMELADGTLRMIENQPLKAPLDVATYGHPKPTVFTAPRTGRYFLLAFSTLDATGYRFSLRRWLADPGSAARDQRDIVLVHSTDGGQTWSAKQRVNDDPAGADQAMPSVATDDLGRVYVGWYDWRDAVDGVGANAYAAVSSDDGVTFSRSLRLSSRSSSWLGGPHPDAPIYPGEVIGDRIAVAAGDDYGLVAWTDTRDWPVGSDVYVARIVDAPTAVEAVSDFSAEPVAGGVRLRWLVNDARGVVGLRLYRSGEDGNETALGEADVRPEHDGESELLDGTAEPGKTFSYRLRVTTAAGLRWLGPVHVRVPSRISALAWRAASPNPFARRTTVTLALPKTADGAVHVYDVQGKDVRTLAAGRFEAGERTIEWDGRDGSGGMAPPGIYFLSAEVGGEHARMRLARVP